jgi:hypothetical protein
MLRSSSDQLISLVAPWHKRSPAWRIFQVMNTGCWAISLVALIILGGIQTVALKQPKQPDAIYRHPYQVKGEVRYFTDLQVQIQAVAQPALIVFFVLGGCAAGGCEISRQSDYNRRKQAFFDRLGD